jgi:hypothetical protein
LTQHLIADAERIEQLRERFTLVDKDNTNWTATYIDNDTGDKWLYYRVDTYLQGGGYPILGRQPLPDTKQLINLSLFSESDDEIFAACRTLVDQEEIKKIDFRADLIYGLENINDKQRQEKVIKLTGLDSALNRQEILGKTVAQIDFDAKYYKDIADRANKIKQRTNAQQGLAIGWLKE